MVMRVGVLGGGPAGLVAALALEQYGEGVVDVTLLDKNASESDYPGVEYGIQERACRALSRMGVKDAALRRGNPNREIAFSVVSRGREQGAVKTDPTWCVCVIRQEFLADLAGLLKTTTVKRRTIVEGIDAGDDGRVTVRCTSNGASSALSFDALIAADGVQSIVRRTWFPEFATIHDRGFSCAYFLIEAKGPSAPAGFSELANGGRSELWMGSFSTMTVFPMGHDRLAIGVGFDDATRDRLWAEQGLAPTAAWTAMTGEQRRAIALRLAADVPVREGMFTRLFESFVPDWTSTKIYLWKMRDSDPLPVPYTADPNIVVVGDAAHAFMPTIGMGASLAIEDAERLAACISAVARRHPDVDAARRALRTEAFAVFSRERVPVWNELMFRARWAGRNNFHNQRERRRFAIAPMVPGFVPSRLVGAAEWAADRLGL
jgi:salicylate hydroxylase